MKFPKKLQFLFEPHPYKILYGGRDGIKSWSVAQALLIMGAQNRLRWLCARETQQSIKESVHHLLASQIARLNLGGYYRVEKARIVGTKMHPAGMYGRTADQPGISEFVFAGLRHNVNGIKSFEELDGVWVEEAANVSKNSWEVVIPTIRKEGSEIWATYNPELESDDTHQRWAIHPPPDAKVVMTSYRDNNWLSQTSLKKIKLLQETDPDTYAQIYEGATKNTLAGAIYAKELRKVDEERRITRVPYDPTRLVQTFWDLGYGDATSIWFVQAFPFEYRIIDFLQNSREPLSWYLKQLQERPYAYGSDFLPHDGKAKNLGTGKSVEELMRAAGRRVQIVASLSIADGINAARTIFGQCWFDADKCADGLQALRHYVWGELASGAVTRLPKHDEHSHPADAWRMFAVGIRPPKAKEPEQRPRPSGEYAWNG